MINLSESKASSIIHWTLLGPFFVCMALILPFLISSSLTIYIIIAITGLPICWRYGLSGFFLSLVFMASMLLYALWSKPSLLENSWEIGIGSSLALGLLITALTEDKIESEVAAILPDEPLVKKIDFDKTHKDFQNIKEQLSRIQEELAVEKELHETCQECLDELNQEHNRCSLEAQKLREQVQTLKQEKKLLENSLSMLQQENVKFDKEKCLSAEQQEEWKIKALKHEKECQHALSQLDEAIKEHTLSKEQLKEFDRELRRSRGYHMQLRAQFDQKCKELEKTRYALFHAEEKLVLLQKETAEDNIFEQKNEDKEIDRHINKMGELFLQKEQELDQLHELVTVLLKKKPRKAVKRTRSQA